MLFFENSRELIEALEDRAQKSRDKIGTSRTRLEDNMLKGEVYAFNEAIYYVKAFIRSQELNYAKPANAMEPVDDNAHPDPAGTPAPSSK